MLLRKFLHRTIVFYRLIVRPLVKEPMRTGLTVLAVALGVAVVLAIELAGDAAAGSFHSSVEALAGTSQLEVTAGGGVPDRVVGMLARLSDPIQIHPRIQDFATDVDTGRNFPLIGLDIVAEANDAQTHAAADTGGTTSEPGNVAGGGQGADVLAMLKDLQQDDSVWVSPQVGRMAGDKIELQINDRIRGFVVRGVLPESADDEGVIVMDIAAAQQAVGRVGRVDRILIHVPDESKPEALARETERLRAVLPPGVVVRPQGSGTEQNQKMLSAFRLNLRVLSYVALVVGAFLIYNTISVSVVRRRAEIGIVRALGASRRSVLAAFIGEAACLGFAGACIGLPLGRGMASGAVRLIGSTVQSLYVSSRPGPIEITGGTVLLAFFVGVGVAVASAAAPAREASLVSPVEAMARGRREHTARMHKLRDLWFAVALGLAGLAASQAPAVSGRPLFGYLAAVLFIAASAFAIPAIVDALSTISSDLLRKIFGVEALLAARSLNSSLRRTSVLVGALSTAIAMVTAVGIMVGSFRETVLVWMNDQLPADLYLRPAGDEMPDRHPTMDAKLADAIAKLPGVAGVDRFRAYEISYDGLPATLGGADLSVPRSYSESHFLSGRPGEEVIKELEAPGTALVSEPFANKHHVRAGDTITLSLGDQKPTFRVVDIYYDYASEHGFIILNRDTLLRYLPDPSPSNMGVYAKPGTNLIELRSQIEKAAAGGRVLILSDREIRDQAIRIFDRTFAITYALEIVSIVIAVMGIAGALLALVIDRRREFGLLRFLGASTAQIRRMIFVEAGLIGLLANVVGIALGLVLALLLVFVINKQSFGWTIQFHSPAAILIGALTLVYAVTILAGFYPARVATQLNPIEAVHEE